MEKQDIRKFRAAWKSRKNKNFCENGTSEKFGGKNKKFKKHGTSQKIGGTWKFGILMSFGKKRNMGENRPHIRSVGRTFVIIKMRPCGVILLTNWNRITSPLESYYGTLGISLLNMRRHINSHILASYTSAHSKSY